MNQQSILHLVVNWEVFIINICCFIAKILFQISIFTSFGLLIKLGLRSGGQIYTTMQYFVKIGRTRYHVFCSIFKMAAVRNVEFSNYQICGINVHRHTNFVKIGQTVLVISRLFDFQDGRHMPS